MVVLGRTEAQINAAKKGQIARLGGSDLPKLKRKKCKKGKSCGASCIPGYHVCMVDIPWALNPGLNKAVAAIKKVQGVAQVKVPVAKAPAAKTPAAKTPAAKTPVAKTPVAKPPIVGAQEVKTEAKTPIVNLPVKAKEVYDIIDSPGFKLRDVDGSKAAKSIDWNAVGNPNAVQMGAGMFGAFFKVPNGALGRNVGIKAGEIGLHEAEALKIVGKAGIGPKFIAAQHGEFGGGRYRVATGRIAMGVVQGTPLYKSPGVVNGITTRDAYWTARAKIHRLGVAHNDTHAGNIMIDNKGVARFVDLGLAQVSRKAALAEALGGASRTGADFEAEKQLYSRGKGKIFNLISSNIRTVVEAMKADGLSDSDVRRFRSTDIRQKDEYFNTNPSWSKITDKQAKKYIDLLYDGV
jgi:hypothetical protein